MPPPHDETQSARIHLASQDPAFPARREEAYQTIVTAIDSALTPRGYALKGSTWSRATPQGKSAVHLQRSHYGWDVQIALRFLTPDGTTPATGDWPEDEDIRLSRFCTDATDPGTIVYLDVQDNPALLTYAIDLLTTKALPWLEAHHAAP
jgi:hypothetical protein